MLPPRVPKKFMLLFLAVAGCILWQLLAPGYVLTLDMIFVPKFSWGFSSFGYQNTFPFQFIFGIFSKIFPVWFLQKFILMGLFFGMLYFAFRFLPLPKDDRVRLFTALFYTLNPFVYTRFLAGHWFLLLGYVLLPIWIHFCFSFFQNPNKRSTFGLIFSLFMISIFSLHLFVFCALVVGFTTLGRLFSLLLKKKKKLFQKLLFWSGGGLLLLLLLSAYWMLPVLFHFTVRPELFFDLAHAKAFVPAGQANIPVLLNILMLFGFWGEAHPWANQFVWPQTMIFFQVLFALFFGLVLLGMWSGFKNKKIRPVTFFFVLLGIFSLFLGLGVVKTPLQPVNLWLFEHIGFWRGFRDSQKLSAFLALSYSVLSGYGVWFLLERLKSKKNLQGSFQGLSFVLPILLGFFFWGGFRGQLHTVWYPNAWKTVHEILQEQGADEKVLFLPWHGYLSLNFNHNILIANPARAYFGPNSIVSKSVELGPVYDQEQGSEYQLLDRLVRESFGLPVEETIAQLQKSGIGFIVMFDPQNTSDFLPYSFLKSSKLELLYQDLEIVLWKIVSE